MRGRDLLSVSLRGAFRRARKTALSAAAVAVAIASLILISAVGNGTSRLAEEELARLGIDGLSLFLDGTEDRTLDPGCASMLEEHVDGILSATPFRLEIGSAQMLTTCQSAVIWGVGGGMIDTMGLKLLHGREISGKDISACAHTAVIDAEFARSVYRRENTVGKTLRIKVGEQWDSYEIIGIIAPQTGLITSLAGTDIGRFLYIPYTTVNENTGEYGVDQIAIRCDEAYNAEEVGKAAVRYLSRVMPTAEGKYHVENITGYLDRVKQIVQLIRLLILAVGGISLLVAGISVMNGMLAGMEERKRELGIYLAVGAVRRDIIWNLILESLFVCLTGGVIGSIAGICGSLLLSGTAPCQLEAGDILWAAGLSCVCGLLFGTIPAIRASRLDPIRVLRQD